MSQPSNVVGGFKFVSGGAQRPSTSSSSASAVAVTQQHVASPVEMKRSGKDAASSSSSSSSSAFVPAEGLSAAWITPSSNSSSSTTTTAVALDVIESFLAESAKIHTSFVRTNFSSSHPYLDGAVSTLYEGFLKSSKQLIADDKKGGESLSTTHPVNDANRKKEARATLQIEKYSEELKQWTALLKANADESIAAGNKGGRGGGGRSGAAADFDDEEMDADLLAKFSIVNDLEVGISEAVESVSNSVTAVTESVRTARRHVRAANAGVKAASTLLHDKVVGGGVGTGRLSTKALLKEIVSSGPPSAAKRPPPPPSSSVAPPSASKRSKL